MQSIHELDLSLPYITEKLKGIGGSIRVIPQDFYVEEIPLYEPSGSGSHLYLNITKINKTTRDIQLGLAKLFELKPEVIGKAGLKDKNAVTTQTFSVFIKNSVISPSEAINLVENSLEVKVNWARYHNNKLRAGHLLGNKFRINIKNVDTSSKDAYNCALRIAYAIHEIGLPNYYGEQRIGDDGSNVIQGLEIILGRKKIGDRWLRKYLISSYQSYLCNRYLSERVRRGLFTHILRGDIAKKHDTGGVFWVEDPSLEQQRFDSKEISFTAPIYGYKMAAPNFDAAIFEEAILTESGISIGTLRENRIKGTRRLGRLIPKIGVTEISDGIQLRFDLPKGGFATTLLREFMKNSNKFS